MQKIYQSLVYQYMISKGIFNLFSLQKSINLPVKLVYFNKNLVQTENNVKNIFAKIIMHSNDV